MELYVFPPSPNCLKVIALGRQLQLPLRLHNVSIPRGEHKLREFLELNPNGRLPLLVDGPLKLWESDAILYYLADRAGSELLPKPTADRADILRWMFWQAAHFAPACGTLLFEHVVKPVMGLGAPDAQAVARGEAALQPLLQVLEHQLAENTWICGPRLSIADFSIAAFGAYQEEASLPFDAYPAVQGWYRRIAELPAWQEALEGRKLP